MKSSVESWLLINKAPGVGPSRIQKLKEYFGDIETACKAKSFPASLGIPQKAQAFLNSKESINSISADLKWLESESNHLLTIQDDLYPPLLKETSHPPVVLYVKGQLDKLLMPQLAVVGSRNASSVGLQNCRAFCSHLASSGLTITSGLALGIDAESHHSALKSNGNTIAVMATGLDSVYPSKNRDLAHQIAESGALVSEYAIGTRPSSFNFPQRNRIICGLSLGTLVVEAGLKSGTLISARLTMEMNRPVLAIPGSIHNPLAKGCHQLIKQGAKLVECAEDILEELTPVARTLSESLKSQLSEINSSPDLSLLEQDEIEVLNLLTDTPLHLDDLVESTTHSTTELSQILLNLELNGFVIKNQSGGYSKKH